MRVDQGRLDWLFSILAASLLLVSAPGRAQMTAAPLPIELTRLDPQAIAYATFQSHNQKVVANAHGIFTTHVRAANDKYTAQQWRLSRSTDGGKTFTTILEDTHDTNPPLLETDRAGNLYLARWNHNEGTAFLYYLAAPHYTQPRITPIPRAASGKCAMILDEDRQRLYFISQNETFHVLALDGTVLRSTRLYQRGPKAYVMYESLALGPDGALYVGLTTQSKDRYNYWSVHWLVTRDQGATWTRADQTPLPPPVILDDTGPADRLSLDDEFEVHSWLSSWLFANDRVHAVYWADTQPQRQHYLRLNPQTGEIEVRQERIFGERPMTKVNDAGLLVRGQMPAGAAPGTPVPLYFVSTVEDRSRLACLASQDNGQTWQLHALSDRQFDRRVYSIGGFREVTAEGAIVGTFTTVSPSAKSYFEANSGEVYFFRVAAQTAGEAALKPGDQPLRRPVVFSYNHPWGSDKSPNEGWTDPWFMDFSKVRLSTTNMVDHVSPEAYAAWRTPERRILARVRQWDYPWQEDKTNDLIRSWDKALQEPGRDGFAMDEFIGKDVTPALMTVWVTAIKEIRRRHPDKILAFWAAADLGKISQHGEAHKPLLEALRDYADFAIPQIYYTEKDVVDFATRPNPFPLFREKVEEWEAQAPGITPKILMGLGTVQNVDWAYDNHPDVDYGAFLAKQVEVCATDPVLKQMAGLALYAPGYLKPATLGQVNEAIIKHYKLER